jgi:hypothetical protein
MFGAEKWGRFGGVISVENTPSIGSGRDPRPSSPARVIGLSSPVPTSARQLLQGGTTQIVPPASGVNVRSLFRPNGDVPRTSGIGATANTPSGMMGRMDMRNSNAGSATPNQGVQQEVATQMEQWDNEMDGLDKKQEQLLNDQWRLLRTQIGTLMGALSEMRCEMTDLKNNVLTKEMEGVITKMIDAHDSHDQNHAGIVDRLKFLETALGESADQHDNHANHKATMETRLEYLENLMGDNADKHDQMVKDLHDKLGGCATADHHAGIDERVSYLEGFLGESADKHAKDLKDAKGGFKEHATTMETRLEYIEGLLGDSSDKHAKELEAAHSKIADMHEAIQACAKSEHHNSMEERVDYLEKFLGESADKHEQELLNHKDAHSEHKTTMETRLEYLEGLMGDSADKHATEIEAAQLKLSDLHDAIQNCAKSDHHNSLEQRMDYLEGFLGESADKHDAASKNHEEHKTTMETRLEYIESLLGDNADKHFKEIEAAKGKLGDLHAAISKCAHVDHASTMEQRVNFIEKLMGDNADKHASDLDNHKNMSLSASKSAETRIEKLEKRASTIESKHLSEFSEHKSTYETHKSFIETKITEIENRHDSHTRAVESRHSNVASTMTDIKALHSKLEQRMDGHERVLADGTDNVARRIAALEGGQMKLKTSSDEAASQIRNEVAVRTSFCDKLDDRVGRIEGIVNDPLDKHFRESAESQAKVRDLFSKLDQQRVQHDSATKNTEQRLGYLEGQIMEGGYGTEFMREMDQRIHYMQEDETRARDMLESSLKEQIRLEHSALHSQSAQIKEQWDREARARQAYMESYKDLLAQERKSRDMSVGQLDERVRNVESRLIDGYERQPVPVVSRVVTNPTQTLVPTPQMSFVSGAITPMSPNTMSPRVPPPSMVLKQPGMPTTMGLSSMRVSSPPSIGRMQSVGSLGSLAQDQQF